MNASLNILTMLTITALAELCVLRIFGQRHSLSFCIYSVAAISGIFWAAFFVAYLEVAHGPSLPRPASTPPPVGSGYDWTIVMFLIHAVIIGVVALVPAGFTAIIYRRFRSQL